MNCTEVFNYIFESFNSNNIDYAIIHSYQYLPDRFDSDIDTAINVPNIKDAIKLLDDTLVGTGWRVIQFWRHENYAADCVISNDDEFLQVAANGMTIRWEGTGINEKGYDAATGKLLVCVNPQWFRPTDVDNLWGDPTKAKTVLGWNPQKTSYEELVEIMAKHDRELAKREKAMKAVM